ncbi:hypothetical protein HPB50_015527 [Hyalomma asiaticum]|uniref:Uncharacterized protein n=1 Tax=Hyalomma asiaticum TaxID=266040 RepID=A0ACB7RK61_HYAAI|nr:hypothetical protein HPB50_015527 [Hyalomma asiaticum]
MCRSLHLSSTTHVGARPTTFTVAGVPIIHLGDYDSDHFLGRPIGFRVLPTDNNIVDEAVTKAVALLS